MTGCAVCTLSFKIMQRKRNSFVNKDCTAIIAKIIHQRLPKSCSNCGLTYICFNKGPLFFIGHTTKSYMFFYKHSVFQSEAQICLSFSEIQPQNMLKLCLSKNIQKSKFHNLTYTWGEWVCKGSQNGENFEICTF